MQHALVTCHLIPVTSRQVIHHPPRPWFEMKWFRGQRGEFLLEVGALERGDDLVDPSFHDLRQTVKREADAMSVTRFCGKL